ncbi:hypothetical protein BDQ12DRAFT_734834 [Crucibulum laeve]|uniref:DUF6593 domain-containing protein n=1 Tax=Crucibulum laeve TaxID=68775 RepID=A0A5C3M3Z1_9AGAR|nr:hypothetical protein BDQ12DRAFT_734834 [Crucibulum laeve]
MDPPQYVPPSLAQQSQSSLPLAPEPVVLSWSPARSHASGSGIPFEQPVPHEDPPQYVIAKKPTIPVTYTFSPLSFNSMILVPPADAPDTRPPYNIAVSMNCFIPSSFITTIRRGGTEYGDFVGDFEMGITSMPGTVFIAGEERQISQVLLKAGIQHAAIWTWKPRFDSKRILQWDTRSPIFTCHLGNSPKRTEPVAMFYPQTLLRNSRTSSGTTKKLKVMPEGQEHFDDILMSLLIIERKRLTPPT